MQQVSSERVHHPFNLREIVLSIRSNILDTILKTAVVFTYLAIATAHVIESPISLLTLNVDRAKLNLTSAKIALFCLKTFFLPESEHLSSRFDFHHMSYGLLTMLLPGRFERFGKWITVCSLVNYDHVGVFGYKEQMYYKTKEESYKQCQYDPSIDGELIPDGVLNWVSEIIIEEEEVERANKICDTDFNVVETVFPADNCLVRNAAEIVSELFFFWKSSPYLDAIIEKKDKLIEDLVKPELIKIENDPARFQMPIAIHFDLFKG